LCTIATRALNPRGRRQDPQRATARSRPHAFLSPARYPSGYRVVQPMVDHWQSKKPLQQVSVFVDHIIAHHEIISPHRRTSPH
jgi:hypothetical protein